MIASKSPGQECADIAGASRVGAIMTPHNSLIHILLGILRGCDQRHQPRELTAPQAPQAFRSTHTEAFELRQY